MTMKRIHLPYYMSRGALSFGFSILVMGLTWTAMAWGSLLFGLFTLYLHSGWFTINTESPFISLQRDTRGYEIQRQSLIAAVVVLCLVYLLSSSLPGLLFLSGNVIFSIGVIVYFTTQFVLFVRI